MVGHPSTCAAQCLAHVHELGESRDVEDLVDVVGDAPDADVAAYAAGDLEQKTQARRGDVGEVLGVDRGRLWLRLVEYRFQAVL